MTKFKYAVVHGRFQPFHDEHLAYINWARTWGDHLFIGITNFDRYSIKEESASQHRHTALANPFSYWERSLMVKDSLLEAGVAPKEFTIVSLPIEAPEKWPEFVPTDPSEAVHLLRIFSAWEQEKANRLRHANYRVISENCDEKLLSASDVRIQIAKNEYKTLRVPPSVKYWLRNFNAANRINELMELEEKTYI
jgi:nicotinamide-nucleotide adenylyltransferase